MGFHNSKMNTLSSFASPLCHCCSTSKCSALCCRVASTEGQMFDPKDTERKACSFLQVPFHHQPSQGIANACPKFSGPITGAQLAGELLCLGSSDRKGKAVVHRLLVRVLQCFLSCSLVSTSGNLGFLLCLHGQGAAPERAHPRCYRHGVPLEQVAALAQHPAPLRLLLRAAPDMRAAKRLLLSCKVIWVSKERPKSPRVFAVPADPLFGLFYLSDVSSWGSASLTTLRRMKDYSYTTFHLCSLSLFFSNVKDYV